MIHPDQTGRNWAGPVIAAVLLIADAWLVSAVWPLITTECRLRRAGEVFAGSPERGLQTLQVGCSGAMSERQRQRGMALAVEAVGRLRGDAPLLTRVGMRAFDPQIPGQPYFTAGREMVLAFDLPPGLRMLDPEIRVTSRGKIVCNVRRSDDAATARGDVPFGDADRVDVDIELICTVGAFGTIPLPVVQGLRLARASAGPMLRLRAGTSILALRDDAPTSLRVVQDTPLRVEVLDDLGVRTLAWRVDGVDHLPFDWADDPAARVRAADLPADVTSRPSRSRKLEFEASNSHALRTQATVELRVRARDGPRVVSARLGDRAVADGGTIYVGERALRLVVVPAEGETPEDLSVTLDGQPLEVSVHGQEASAIVSATTEGSRTLRIAMEGNRELECVIRSDWTPPTIRAQLDPGRFGRDLEVRRAIHEAPIGAIASFSVVDGTGLDRQHVDWGVVGACLDEIVDPEVTEAETANVVWTRRFRVVAAGEALVRVSGSDLAGNRTTIHEYRLRAADPMEGRVVTLNGRPFPGPGPFHCGDSRLELRTSGGIDVDGLKLVVLSPGPPTEPIGHVVLKQDGPDGGRAGALELGAHAASGRRLIVVLARDDRELVKGDVVLDFAPPSILVMNLDEADERDGVRRYFAEPGQRVELRVTDDVSVDLSTISALAPATIEELLPGDSHVGLVLAPPAVVEAAIVVRAADAAGHEAELRFELVMPQRPASSGSRPAVRTLPDARATPDCGPPPPDRAPTLSDLSGLPRVVHPLLGTFVLIPGDAATPPFYMADRELSMKEWRPFAAHMQARGTAGGGTLSIDAARVLNRNANVWKKSDDEPLSGATADLVCAYVTWANEIARDAGVWKVPTVDQWKLAAGRGSHPRAIYPTTANFPDGSDLDDRGSGGALFGRDIIAIRQQPPAPLQPGAYHLRAMAGSLYEWVVDPQGRLRLIGGSAVSPKEACRIDSSLRSGFEVAEYERGLRLVLLPRAR